MLTVAAGSTAGREGLRGADDQRSSVGPDIHEGGIGRVVAGQQSLLGKPETEIAAEERFILAAVRGQDRKTRNGEVRKWQCGESC